MFALIYLALAFLVGDTICRRFFSFATIQHRLAGAFLIGIFFCTWLTYLTALVFSSAANSLLWANILTFIIVGGLIFLGWNSDGIPQPFDGWFGRVWQRLSGRKSDETTDIEVEEIAVRPPGSNTWDWIWLGALLIVGCWLMFATLDFFDDSFKFSVKAWSDFGANLSLAQSMALGDNYPPEHPFFPGETVRYHFLFWFQAANLSFLGLNLAYSVNLLSVLSLAALLVLITTLGETLFNSRVIGRLAGALFFFGSTSLTYISFFLSPEGTLSTALASTTFLNSGYPFRGETWGGLTVNVYGYQRHLIAGSALLLFVLTYLADFYRRKITLEDTLKPAPPEPDISKRDPAEDDNPFRLDDTDDILSIFEPASTPPEPAHWFDDVRDAEPPEYSGFEYEAAEPEMLEDEPKPVEKKPRLTFKDFREAIVALILCGIIIGGLPYWNSAVFIASAIVIGALFVLFPYRRYLAILILVSIVVGLPQLLLLRSGNLAPTSHSLFTWGYIVTNPTAASVLKYIGWTFGFKLVLLVIAAWFASRLQRKWLLAFCSLFPVVFLLQLSTDVFNNHKLLNVWNVLMTLFVAYALWLIGRGGILRAALAIVLLLATVMSSIIDLFPIHNDGFVSIPHKNDDLTTWILENTQPQDIFLSDPYLSHQIVFSGRKLFFGNALFAWTAGYQMGERDRAYRALLRERDPEQLLRLLNENKIAFVAIDDGLRRNPQHPSLNESVYHENFEKVFDDSQRRYGGLVIYKVHQGEFHGERERTEQAEFANADMTVKPVTAFEGGYGKGRGQFATPRGLAVDAEGNIYVADTNNARIQKFSRVGNLLAIFGRAGAGEGELNQPNGIVIDAAGDFYVVDAASNRLLRYRADGTFVKQWNGPDPGFFGPRDVAIGPDGKLYIVDQGRGRIVRLDPATDSFFEWGTLGSDNGQFREATGIAVSADRVYVADAGNDRMQMFDLNGAFLGQWMVPEWNKYPWQYPDVVFDPDKINLYVTDPQTKSILVFDRDGNRLPPLTPPSPADLENPSALAIAASPKGKRLYVLNTGNSRVFTFTIEAGKPAKANAR